jgi:hypothetical protein
MINRRLHVMDHVPDIAVGPFLGKDDAERKAAVEASVWR